MDYYVETYCDKDGNTKKIRLEDAVIFKLSEVDILGYNIEIVKAIAVLIRSSLAKYSKNSSYFIHNLDPLEINDEVFNKLCQDDRLIVKRAVSDTKGIICLYNDKTVDLYYTKCCSGGTANSEDIIGYKINYLRKIICRNCSRRYSEKLININDYAKKLDKKNINYKENIDMIFKDVERDETGRIKSINFLGNNMSGEEFVDFFGIEGNRVYFSEETVKLKIKGEGLGLGICLDGAQKLSENGSDYNDIINYYYTGTSFEKLRELENDEALSNISLIIDPGHGGEDEGHKYGETKEKEVNLKIAAFLKEMLIQKAANIILTRDEDIEVFIDDRIKIINKERTDFFISIHQNNFMLPGVNGIEVFYFEGDREAEKLGRYISEAVNLNTGIKNRGAKAGDYCIFKETKCSGILIECMYMSGNADREKYNEEYYYKIAKGIFEGICKYYES